MTITDVVHMAGTLAEMLIFPVVGLLVAWLVLSRMKALRLLLANVKSGPAEKGSRPRHVAETVLVAAEGVVTLLVAGLLWLWASIPIDDHTAASMTSGQWCVDGLFRFAVGIGVGTVVAVVTCFLNALLIRQLFPRFSAPEIQLSLAFGLLVCLAGLVAGGTFAILQPCL